MTSAKTAQGDNSNVAKAKELLEAAENAAMNDDTMERAHFLQNLAQAYLQIEQMEMNRVRY